jgi:hypothetical protein
VTVKQPTGNFRLFDWLSSGRSARTRELILHGVSLCIALILVSAAYGHLAVSPLKSAVVLALFGCGYAVARHVFKDALYVYPALALWTFAFFLICYAAGVPTILFPAVATALIWVLWLGTLVIREEEKGFSRALHRSIFIATLFFGCWAKVRHGDQHAIPAATFILYGLSLTCFHLLRPRRLHAYTAGICLAVAAFYCARIGALLTWPLYGVAAQPMVLFLLLIAVLRHGQNRYREAFPYYLNAMLLSVLCMGISLIGWRHLLDQFALTAVTFGVPVLIMRRHRKPRRIEAYGLLSGFSFASQACLLAAVPLIVMAPLLSFGNTLVSASLMAVFGLFGMLASDPNKPLACVKRTAFFAAVGGAWIAGPFLGGAPSLLGVAIVAVLWLVAAVMLKRASRPCAGSVTDGLVAIVMVLVLVAAMQRSFDPLACVAAGVTLACALMALVFSARRRVMAWAGAALGIALLVAVVAGLFLSALAQWTLMAVLACVGLVLALRWQTTKNMLSAGASAGAMGCAVLGLSAASALPHGSAVLCMAGSVGIPVALAGLFLKQKQTVAMLWAIAVNIVGIMMLVWTGRELPGSMLGTAVLVLVPFVVVGWLTSRFWSYAMAAAATLALGLVLAAGALFGMTWMFLSVMALLCAVFLQAHFARGDDLTRSAIVGVGHILAMGVAYTLYIFMASHMEWQVVLPLGVMALAYASIESKIHFGRTSACFFLSLMLLPLFAHFLGGPSGRALLATALLVPTWAILGCVTHEKRSADYCRASAFLGLYLCFTGATQVADAPGLLFVVSLVGFVICLVVQRDRYFIQVVLLALALVGFTWIRECGTHFTQELYSVILVILGIAMAAEMSPYLVRHLDRSIPIPYVRLFTWRGVGVGVIVGIMVTLVCVSGFALAVTEHPAFCKSCHNMDQFFDSWQHSSHGEVACVECHYEPGLVALVEGKIGAMSQLVSFLTHRYGAKPHAEVSNKACQQPGCHSDIEENTDVFYDDRIHFSHDLHHDAMIKGKSLPCTTCHSQEQRDEHIEVSSSTCFLCHFHGTGPATEKTADCKSCHDAPRGAAGEAGFNHDDFFAGRTDVDCHHCHMRVNQGDASVSAIRCQSCHYGNQLAVVDLTDIKALHNAHVHERQIGCFECHNVLKHGITTKASPLDAQECATCHSERQHSLQTAMYLGTAAKDVPGEPNVMYDADISCNHCHVQEKEMSLDGHVFTTHVSTAENCSACHGDGDYKEMYETWQDETAEAITQLKTDLEQARATVDKAGAGKAADEARQLLDRADELHEIVRRDGSSGVHNILYVEDILSEARRKMSMAEASVGAVNP